MSFLFWALLACGGKIPPAVAVEPASQLVAAPERRPSVSVYLSVPRPELGEPPAGTPVAVADAHAAWRAAPKDRALSGQLLAVVDPTRSSWEAALGAELTRGLLLDVWLDAVERTEETGEEPPPLDRAPFIAAVEAWIVAAPDDALALYWRGHAVDLGTQADDDPRAAALAYEAVVERFPAAPEAERARLQLGLYAFDDGRHADALRWLSGAGAEASERRIATYYTAWSHLETGDTASAEAAFASLLGGGDDFAVPREFAWTLVDRPDALWAHAEQPWLPDAGEALAQLLREHGSDAQARAVWGGLADRYPNDARAAAWRAAAQAT